jgi:hypothetical protein
VEFIYSNAGETNENVIHVYKGSPFTLAQLQALRAVCNTWDSTDNLSMRCSAATLTRIRTKALDTNSSPTEDFTLPTPRAGTGSGAALPLNACLCLKVATGLAGRSYRGRWYAGNLGAAMLVDAGHTNVATVAAYASHLTNLLTALATGGYTWCITSYRNNKAWRTTAVNTAVTTILGVDVAIDSQRRRLVGRGHGP